MCCVSFVYQMTSTFMNKLYNEIYRDEISDNAYKTAEEIVPLKTITPPPSPPPKEEQEKFEFDFECVEKDEAT